jgi:FHA domain
MKVLEIRYSDGNVRRVEFDNQTYKVGRSSHNDIVIKNEKVSREHGHFTASGGVVTFFDRSKNGSKVNGKTVKNSGVQLQVGDVVELPGARIEFRGDDMRAGAAAGPMDSKVPVIAAVSFLAVLLIVAALVYFLAYSPKGEYDTVVDCCKIANFRAGVITTDVLGTVTVVETSTIPRIPDTKFGISFDYEIKNGKSVKYHQEILYPYVPEGMESQVTGDGIFQLFPKENRGIFTSTLTADKGTFAKVFTMDAVYPVGAQAWKIYLDDELFKTITFVVVAQDLPKEEVEEKKPVKKKRKPKPTEVDEGMPPEGNVMPSGGGTTPGGSTDPGGSGTTPPYDGSGTPPPYDDGGTSPGGSGGTSPYDGSGGTSPGDSSPQRRGVFDLLFPWRR